MCILVTGMGIACITCGDCKKQHNCMWFWRANPQVQIVTYDITCTLWLPHECDSSIYYSVYRPGICFVQSPNFCFLQQTPLSLAQLIFVLHAIATNSVYICTRVKISGLKSLKRNEIWPHNILLIFKEINLMIDTPYSHETRASVWPTQATVKELHCKYHWLTCI